ncbi:hypothetical protein [Teredinibacter haidensis]|uniref:hypothetical protein n=1 Tax=Teredinibacter haidensis TaxID=2731755 RepID=UPI0009490E5C|nr:hypothetical protein [Teredinibacter haidensis]
MKNVFLLFIFCFIVACATPPSTSLNYDNADVGTPNEEYSVLVLYRKMVPPVMYKVSASLNGKSIAQLPNKAFTWVYITKGEHEIKIKWPGIAMTPSTKINLTAEPGRYYFVEFGGSTYVSGTGVAYNLHGAKVRTYEESVDEVRSCCGFIPSLL